MNGDLPDVQAGFRKGRGTNIRWIIEKAREFQKKHLLQSFDYVSSVQFISAAQSCPTLCNSMNCSTPGLPVHHQLPESTQTLVFVSQQTEKFFKR